MVRAILFDMGGTLDGDGVHWLDRFVALYRSAGVSLPRENLRSAFDAAEARAAGDPVIATVGLQSMIERHVDWQVEHLGISDVSVRQQLISGFVAPVREVAAANCRLLAELSSRGLLLAVVSNGCGNVDVLCRDYGYAPFLSAIVDSRRVGISKPDPAIFTRAAALLGSEPADTLVVGDSFERDIVPAKRAGMITAWLQPDPARSAPDGSVVDVRLTRLADVAAWLPAPARIA
jgi:putative hydrolase of the HAD superfamily